MKKTLLMSLAALSLFSNTLQAAPTRLPVLSGLLAPPSLGALPRLPALPLLTNSDGNLTLPTLPGLSSGLPALIGTGSTLIGDLKIPKLGTTAISRIINFGEDVIVGLGKVGGPPQPPR